MNVYVFGDDETKTALLKSPHVTPLMLEHALRTNFPIPKPFPYHRLDLSKHSAIALQASRVYGQPNARVFEYALKHLDDDPETMLELLYWHHPAEDPYKMTEDEGKFRQIVKLSKEYKSEGMLWFLNHYLYQTPQLQAFLDNPDISRA